MAIIHHINYDSAKLPAGYAGVAKFIQDESLYFENLSN